MKTQRIVIALCFLAVGGAGYWAIRTAEACDSCGSAPVDSHAVKHTEDKIGDSCSLDSHARVGPIQEYIAFNTTYLEDVQVSITNSYVGDKALLESTLNKLIALESSCCAHLTISKKETPSGYSLTVAGNRDAIPELQFHLSSSTVK